MNTASSSNLHDSGSENASSTGEQIEGAAAATGGDQGGHESGGPPKKVSDLPPPPPPPSASNRDNVGFNEEALHDIRDPKSLVGYIVPLPKPPNAGDLPVRFLIYTPPPPPLKKPEDGEKEGKRHKIGRKWQEEVREAKSSDAKLTSWEGVKSSAMKGISNVMSKTSSSNVDFLGRLNIGEKGESSTQPDKLILFYPASFPSSPDEMRSEFINTMMRAKNKAQRDAVIATGLLPVAEAVDILATVVWPFGGLIEIDGIWAYSSIRGAKAAHDINKRLDNAGSDSQLTLKFVPLEHIDLLSRYLECVCHDVDKKRFPTFKIPPRHLELLKAIGWASSDDNASEQDTRYETSEVIEDMRSVFKKSAKEWVKWLHKYDENPEKALKK